jgi:hypothetical protein
MTALSLFVIFVTTGMIDSIELGIRRQIALDLLCPRLTSLEFPRRNRPK